MQLVWPVTKDVPFPKVINVVHEGKELTFRIGQLVKNTPRLELAIIEINDFLSKRPKALNDETFKTYERILSLYEDEEINKSMELMTMAVIPEIYNLYKNFSYTEFQYYINTESKVIYPEGLKKAYDADTPNKELTYLEPEYRDILALILMIRLMIPVFGEHCVRILPESGSEYKELSALTLLGRTEIKRTSAYQRLERYMEAFVGKDDLSIEPYLNGLPSEKVPEWLLSLVLVRRLAFFEMPLKGINEESSNIIADIYNFVDNRLLTLGKSFDSTIRAKEIRRNGSNDEDTPTQAEIYKIKEEVSEGDLIDNYVYLSVDNLANVAKKIDATIDVSLIEMFMEHNKNLRLDKPNAVQSDLIEIIHSRHISIQAHALIDYESAFNSQCVAQALLYHWKLYDLAAMLTAETKAVPSNVILGTMKLPIPIELQDLLVDKYPHLTTERSTIKRDTRQAKYRLNAAINAADSTTATMDRFLWILNIPSFLQDKITMEQYEGSYTVAKTTKIQLANLYLLAVE